jgi:lysozyme
MLVGFEAMILHEYQDQAGIPTVCVGHVIKPEDQVWLRDGVTRNECLQVLGRDIAPREKAINDLVHVPISQPMIDALVSLVFNIGLDAFSKSSVLSHLNEGDYSSAADAFLLWKYARVKMKDGSRRKLPILLGRRQAEAGLFRSGIPDVTGVDSWGSPGVGELLSVAQQTQFGPLELVPYHPAIEPDEPPEPDLTEDGRLVALPPNPEDNEPQAA